ncbi:MAG: glycogen synthase [Myxococcota bacterium]
MDIAFVTSEIAPFAKVGGLADVSAALPSALFRRGHDVRVFVPLYRRARTAGLPFTSVPGLEQLSVRIGPHVVQFGIKSSKLPGTGLDVFFVDCPGLYDRAGVYTEDHDEHFRYIVLSYAALAACQHMGFSPELVHANDWQTGLLPLILQTRHRWDQKRFGRTKTVLTIHNLAHQGVFGAHTLRDTGLQDSSHLFHQDQLQQGYINHLLTGILYASAVTTVSPTYAAEIQRDETGGTLAPFLRARSSTVVGILNGIGTDEWNPETDAEIECTYSAETLPDKEYNKRAVLQQLGLPYDPAIPLAGVISRLTYQKGLELILDGLPPFLAAGRLQLAVLGSGASAYELKLSALQRRFPRQVCFYRGFSNRLAHRIEAGADLFLMPSRFEPCGLNQLYSLRYGTVPVVRRTGGLADTVHPFSLESGRGTGFVFQNLSVAEMQRAVQQALMVWQDRSAWRRLQLNGMLQDFTWDRQVQTYEELYRRVLAQP